ncbi:MAG TPA: hypothetical protein VGI19_09040 [Candidatus Cybelea sp.]|jgi:hypothetical protein
MLDSLSRRVLIAAAAVSFAAGCSGNALTPGGQSSVTPNAHQVGGGFRILPGPVVSGPIVVPLVAPRMNAPFGWPDKKKKHKEMLFVADSSGVLIYNPKKANSGPIGSITTGTSSPFGVALDKKGNLYVANIGNSTVTVYPKGKNSPSLTISTGISSPYSIAVDSKADIFVSNLGDNNITAYKSGSGSPYETISFGAYGQAVGIGLDASDNLWVACDSTNQVFEIKAGSTGVTSAGLVNLGGPIGISFGQKDQFFVSNFSLSDVDVFDYGTTSAKYTIGNGIEKYGPTQNGLDTGDELFQTNQSDNVVGYKKGADTPFSTLTGATSAAQIVGWPLVKK